MINRDYHVGNVAGVFRRYKVGHPCPRPLDTMMHIVGIAAKAGEIIVDPFMGSGTTLRAAKDMGRKAIGIEIEEVYCESAAKLMRQGVLLSPTCAHVKQSWFFAEPVRVKGRRVGKQKGTS